MSKPILAAVLSCAGTELTDEEKYLFSSSNPLGISLFARNIRNKIQLKKLVIQIKNVINRDDVWIAVDEEGGRVARLKMIIKLKHLTNQQLASEEDLGKVGVKYTQMHAEIISKYMHQYGVNINYAPVIDKKVKGQSLVLQSRCFSSEADKIIRHAQKMADTYIKNNICPCIKHLPGHLGATADPHLDVPVCDLEKEALYREIEYIKAFKQYPMAMTAHILLKNIDDTQPITMSEKGIKEIIRNYLEYDGFLLSDAIDMHALKGSITEKTENCLNAGLDAICYCGGKYEDLYNICNQKRFMTEKAQIRFANIKKVIHNTKKEIDTSEVEALYLQKFQDKLNKQYKYDATEVLHQMLVKGES